MIGRVTGRRPRRQRRGGAEGRHAAHLCRHVAGARGSGLRADRGARGRAWRPSINGWLESCDQQAPSIVRPARSRWRPWRWRSRRAAPRTRAAPSRPAPLEPDKFLFDKGNDALNDKKWLNAREYFKQVVETYTAEPVSAGRQARHRRHLPRRRHRRGAGPGDQRVHGVPLVLPDQPPRRLRAVQAGAGALPADAAAGARPDRDARRDRASSTPSSRATRTAS